MTVFVTVTPRVPLQNVEGLSARGFIIFNRTAPDFRHDYDIVIGPVADAFVDKEIERHCIRYGIRYLETEALLDLAERISQFGESYEQYCFTTERSILELIRE